MKVKRVPGPGDALLKKVLNNLGNTRTKVGVIEALKYEDGTPVAYVAAIQEFGDPARSLPPRSFMRTTFSEQQNQWANLATNGAKAIAKGNATSLQVADLLGITAAADVRAKISSITSPPLTDTTLRLRKLKREGASIGGKVVGDVYKAVNSDNPPDLSGVSTKPLVFDGVLIGAITSQTDET